MKTNVQNRGTSKTKRRYPCAKRDHKYAVFIATDSSSTRFRMCAGPQTQYHTAPLSTVALLILAHSLVPVFVLGAGESILDQERLHDLEGLHALLVGEDDGAGPGRRQVRELLTDARVRQLHLRDELASHARDDTCRLEGEVLEIEEDGHEVSRHVAHHGIAKYSEMRLVQEQGRRVLLGQGHGEKPGLENKHGDQARVELGVDIVQPAPAVAVAVPATISRVAPAGNRAPIRRGLGNLRVLPARADDQRQALLNIRHNVALPQCLKCPDLQLGDAGGRRRRGRLAADACPANMVVVMGDEGGVGLGELKATGQEGLLHRLAVLRRHQDEVRVVRGDEEDGDACKGKRRRQLHDTSASVHSGTLHRQDEVAVLGDGDGARGILGQLLDDRLKDLGGPVGVAHDRALDRGDADVEEPMLVVVYAQPLNRLVQVVGIGIAALGQQHLQYRLQEHRIEAEGDVY